MAGNRNNSPSPAAFSVSTWLASAKPASLLCWGLVVFILFTRFWNLGLKPVQHDESMFAYYSWLIFEKMPKGIMASLNPANWNACRGGYDFNPMLHGPLLQWVTAATFRIFGDSDYTMRLAPTLCGIGIFISLYCLRREIGLRPAYLAIALLAISPTLTFVTRYIRPDMLIIYLYIAIIHAGWRYSVKPTGLRLFIFLILCWTASMTHETYFIYFFFMATFGVGCWIHGFVNKKPFREIPFCREAYLAVVRHWWALIPGMALGALLTVAVHTSFFKFTGHWDGQIESFKFWLNEHEGHRIKGEFHYHLIMLAIYELPLTIFFTFCIVRQMWATEPGPTRFSRRIIFLAWLAASVLLLNLPAFWTPEAGDYLWKCKLSERWYKLLHMTMGFHIWMFVECLIVVFITGWIHLSRGRVFHALCDYWTVGSFLAYNFAGEKVPWVTAHIALPMTISCALYLDMVLQKYFPGWPAFLRTAPESEPAEAASVVAQEPEGAARTARERGRGRGAQRTGAKAGSVGSRGERTVIAFRKTRYVLTACAAVSLVWTLYVGTKLCFIQSGSPMERLTYSSSHTQFHSSVRYIIRECFEKHQGYDTPLAFGGQPSWPLHWTLRNFKKKLEFGIDFTRKTYVPNSSKVMAYGKEAEYVIIDSDMMDVWTPSPAFKNRYIWASKRFRHFWTPEPLKWKTMKKIGLLLRSDASLSPERLAEKKICRKEWVKFLSAYFLRDEELTRDGGPRNWFTMGGYNAYFGKLRPMAVAPPTAGN